MSEFDSLVAKLYKPGKTSLRQVAKDLGTDHHRVKRALNRIGVPPVKAKRGPLSEGHRQKISQKSKGRVGWSKGKKMPESSRLKNLIAHTRFDLDLEWASKFNLDTLMVINRMITPRSGRWRISSKEYQAIVEKFHNDRTLLRLIKEWRDSGKEHYRLPTFDHIIPTSRGGKNNPDNLQVMTWFENRCKNHMSQSEWTEMKKKIDTYFT